MNIEEIYAKINRRVRNYVQNFTACRQGIFRGDVTRPTVLSKLDICIHIDQVMMGARFRSAVGYIYINKGRLRGTPHGIHGSIAGVTPTVLGR